MVLLYQTLMALLYPLARLLGFFIRTPDFQERLGFYSASDRQKLSTGYNVWLHAASAGEVNAIMPFCQTFRKAKPDIRILLTTTSVMGKKVALEKGMADAVFLAPLDMAGPLKRVFRLFRPVMVFVAETEFWPNWLVRAGQNGIPVVLVNGRVSDRSFPRYQTVKSLFAPVLNCFTLCLVQTPKDRERLAALGVSPGRIQVAGQMKYDRSAPSPLDVQRFKEKLSLLKKDIFFTFGSLRGGESELLNLVPALLAFSPDTKVLIAPRHLKNAPLFQEKLRALQVGSVLRSELEKNHNPERVIVLDTVGELSLAYAFSRAAFVGGTLVPIGGHNVMEPALSYVPVCFGPHTQNVSEAAQALLQSGGGFLVQDGKELLGAFERFLDEGFAREAGKWAHDSVAAMRGATERTVGEILTRWPMGKS